MHDDDGSLTRRLHWQADPERAGEPEPEDADDLVDEDRPLAGALTPANPLTPANALTPASDPAPAPVRPENLAQPRSFERRELDRLDDEALDRRRVLWRDTALILVGVVVALLVWQVLLPKAGGLAGASPTPFSTNVVIGPAGSVGPSTGVTAGPSLGSGAAATPSPPPTEPPTGSAAPVTTPRPTPRPTPKPTAKPTPTPRPTEPPTPAPTPEITQPAAPVAAFTWSQSLPLIVTFANGSTGETDWLWDFGDGNTSTQQNPEHAYLEPGDYVVRLTVTGPGGSDFVEHTVTVSAA